VDGLPGKAYINVRGDVLTSNCLGALLVAGYAGAARGQARPNSGNHLQSNYAIPRRSNAGRAFCSGRNRGEATDDPRVADLACARIMYSSAGV
jgi:hypothetical protein